MTLGQPVLALPYTFEQLVPFFMTWVCRGRGSNPWPPVPRRGHSTDSATGAGGSWNRSEKSHILWSNSFHMFDDREKYQNTLPLKQTVPKSFQIKRQFRTYKLLLSTRHFRISWGIIIVFKMMRTKNPFNTRASTPAFFRFYILFFQLKKA